MAFLTLDQIRTGYLNPALGLAGDSETTFGSTTVRNAALQHAFARLWPQMPRLRRESITLTASTVEYTLSNVQQVEVLEVLDSTGLSWSNVTKFRVYTDESATTDAPVFRLLLKETLANANAAGGSMRAVGWSPYKIPTTGSDTCDLPLRAIYVPVLGAAAYCYRNQLNQFIASERRGSSNPATQSSAQELLAMTNMLEQQFLAARSDNARGLTVPHSATF